MITLTKNSIIYKNDYEPSSKEYICKIVKSVIPFLDNNIEIKGNFTLADFFRIIEREKGLFEEIFSSQMGHFPIQPYIDEIKKRKKGKLDKNEIDYLEVHWYIDVMDWSKYNDIKSNENELTIGPGFHGWGPWDDIDEKGNPIKGGMAIEFTPLNKLKDYKIVLDKNLVIPGNPEDPKDYGKIPNLFEGIRNFTVYDVFGAILSELTFAGNPEDRNKQWKKITKDIKEMKEVAKNKDKKNRFVDWKEVKKEMEKK